MEIFINRNIEKIILEGKACRGSVLIIPSLNPSSPLIEYVSQLIAHGFKKIILIDDGSNEAYRVIFEKLNAYQECDILTHAVNMGKGRALKDAFNYYLCTYSDEFGGVITADSDGQHSVEDVIRLDEAMRKEPEALHLGVRDFDNPSVPPKSKFGNKTTRMVMKIFLGGVITDTQTGLRGISNQLLPSYLTLFGERFEYETTMLIEALHTRTPIRETTIQTIYINDNSETHFRPIQDSIAIYRLIFASFFKYMLSSITSFVIDYGIFYVMTMILGGVGLTARVWISTVVARMLSSLYNYTMNRTVVFHSQEGKMKTLMKYYALCIVQTGCSAIFVLSFCRLIRASETIVKPIVDIFLFLISFQIQRSWIFGGKKS